MWPLRATQWMAQVNALVLFAIVAWWTERDRRPRAAACFLAVAAAVKMSPALLLLVPPIQRRFRELFVGAAGTAALIIGSCLRFAGRGTRFLSDVVLGFLPSHRLRRILSLLLLAVLTELRCRPGCAGCATDHPGVHGQE